MFPLLPTDGVCLGLLAGKKKLKTIILYSLNPGVCQADLTLGNSMDLVTDWGLGTGVLTSQQLQVLRRFTPPT